MTRTTMNESRRFKLVVAYDGRSFEGWQSQPGGETIQDYLMRAAREIHPDIRTIQGSGRTDAGVHALAQVAHFDAPPESRMSGRDWRMALNSKLPGTIRIMRCEETSPDFHARFSATGKTYEYVAFTGAVLPPLHFGRAWHIRKEADAGLLRRATKLFRGRQDFSGFAANRGDPESNPRDTHRTIDRAEVVWDGEWMRFTFHGEGFLYKQVRLMVGGIVRCAQGGIEIGELKRLLETPGPGRKSPLAAPADGLYLVSVDYVT